MRHLIRQLLSLFSKRSPDDERQRAMKLLGIDDDDLAAVMRIRRHQRRGMTNLDLVVNIAKLTSDGFEALGGSTMVYAKKPKELLKKIRVLLNQKELSAYDYRKVYALLAAYGKNSGCSFPYFRNPPQVT